MPKEPIKLISHDDIPFGEEESNKAMESLFKQNPDILGNAPITSDPSGRMATEAKIEHGGVALVNQSLHQMATEAKEVMQGVSQADIEIITSIRRELVDLRKELAHEQQVNRELDELSVERLNQINKLTQEKIAGGTFGQQCFLAVVQGMAAHGDLSLGKPSSDQHTASLAKHAAGVAAFMAQAAKTSRL